MCPKKCCSNFEKSDFFEISNSVEMCEVSMTISSENNVRIFNRNENKAQR